MFNSLPSITRGVLFLSAIVLFAQCEKEEPTTEASIEVTLGLYTNSALQGKLTVEQAILRPSQVDMLAKRTDGVQLTFSQVNADEDKAVNIAGTEASRFMLDAEQGKYDPLEVTLILEEDPYTLGVTPGTVETPPTVE